MIDTILSEIKDRIENQPVTPDMSGLKVDVRLLPDNVIRIKIMDINPANIHRIPSLYMAVSPKRDGHAHYSDFANSIKSVINAIALAIFSKYKNSVDNIYKIKIKFDKYFYHQSIQHARKSIIQMGLIGFAPKSTLDFVIQYGDAEMRKSLNVGLKKIDTSKSDKWNNTPKYFGGNYVFQTMPLAQSGYIDGVKCGKRKPRKTAFSKVIGQVKAFYREALKGILY